MTTHRRLTREAWLLTSRLADLSFDAATRGDDVAGRRIDRIFDQAIRRFRRRSLAETTQPLGALWGLRPFHPRGKAMTKNENLLAEPVVKADPTLTVREACRRRMPLDGTDAQALEHAITITERERDEARAELRRTYVELSEAVSRNAEGNKR